MAGGRPYGNPRFRSPILISTLSLLSISLLFIFFSPFSSPKSLPNLSQTLSLNPNVDYSFLSSLQKFLSSKPHRSRDDSVISTAGDVKRLDDLMWRRETEKLYEHSVNSVVRVYVYKMPDKFTYDMLELFWSTYKETVNLTSNGSPVHRLIEQVVVQLIFLVWLYECFSLIDSYFVCVSCGLFSCILSSSCFYLLLKKLVRTSF